MKELADDLLEHYSSAIEMVTKKEEFWEAGLWAAKQDHTIHCDSEDSAQVLIVLVVKSILRALKLNHCVESITNKRTLVGTECYVLLIYKPKNQLPFLCIKDKGIVIYLLYTDNSIVSTPTDAEIDQVLHDLIHKAGLKVTDEGKI